MRSCVARSPRPRACSTAKGDMKFQCQNSVQNDFAKQSMGIRQCGTAQGNVALFLIEARDMGVGTGQCGTASD
eukprot:1157469-Pelagomonas_calceolata.AAC.3